MNINDELLNIANIESSVNMLKYENEQKERHISELMIDNIKFNMQETENKILNFMSELNTEVMGSYCSEISNLLDYETHRVLIKRNIYDLIINFYHHELHFEIIQNNTKLGQLTYWKDNRQKYRDKFYFGSQKVLKPNNIDYDNIQNLIICLNDIMSNIDEILSETKTLFEQKLIPIVDKFSNELKEKKEEIEQLKKSYSNYLNFINKYF